MDYNAYSRPGYVAETPPQNITIDQNLLTNLERGANLLSSLAQKIGTGEANVPVVVAHMEQVIAVPGVPQKYKDILSGVVCLLSANNSQANLGAAQKIIQGAANAFARASTKVAAKLAPPSTAMHYYN